MLLGMNICPVEIDRGRGCWKFNATLLEDKIYTEEMLLKMQRVANENNKMGACELWENIKNEIASFTMKYVVNKGKKS